MLEWSTGVNDLWAISQVREQ